MNLNRLVATAGLVTLLATTSCGNPSTPDQTRTDLTPTIGNPPTLVTAAVAGPPPPTSPTAVPHLPTPIPSPETAAQQATTAIAALYAAISPGMIIGTPNLSSRKCDLTVNGTLPDSPLYPGRQLLNMALICGSTSTHFPGYQPQDLYPNDGIFQPKVYQGFLEYVGASNVIRPDDLSTVALSNCAADALARLFNPRIANYWIDLYPDEIRDLFLNSELFQKEPIFTQSIDVMLLDPAIQPILAAAPNSAAANQLIGNILNDKITYIIKDLKVGDVIAYIQEGGIDENLDGIPDIDTATGKQKINRSLIHVAVISQIDINAKKIDLIHKLGVGLPMTATPGLPVGIYGTSMYPAGDNSIGQSWISEVRIIRAKPE